MYVGKNVINWAKEFQKKSWFSFKMVSYCESLIGKWGGVKVMGNHYGKITKDIRGKNNVVSIGDGAWLNNLKIRIRGNNNKIIIGKKSVVRAHSSFWMEGNNCIISIGDAPKTLILKGVCVGDGSIIGSNSVVTKSIPTNSLAVGQPAKVVKNNIRWTRERKYYDHKIPINE